MADDIKDFTPPAFNPAGVTKSIIPVDLAKTQFIPKETTAEAQKEYKQVQVNKPSDLENKIRQIAVVVKKHTESRRFVYAMAEIRKILES